MANKCQLRSYVWDSFFFLLCFNCCGDTKHTNEQDIDVSNRQQTTRSDISIFCIYFFPSNRESTQTKEKTECWFIYVTKCVPVDAPSNSTYTTRTLIRPKVQLLPLWYYIGNAQKLNERSDRNCDELRCACMRNNFYECLIHSFVSMLNSKSTLKC